MDEHLELGEYMHDVWERGGKLLCAHCNLPIYLDHDSGYYIHAGHSEVDGANGLYCFPEMWKDESIRKYCYPGNKELSGWYKKQQDKDRGE